MFYTFCSVVFQLVRTIGDYQKSIDAYCKTNNIDPAKITTTLVTIIEIAQFMQGTGIPMSKAVINGALTLAGKMNQTTAEMSEEMTSKAAQMTPEKLVIGAAQIAWILAGKPGSAALEGMGRLHDTLLSNGTSSAWDFHDDDYVKMVNDPDNDFVVIELASRDVIMVDDPENPFVIVELIDSEPNYFSNYF